MLAYTTEVFFSVFALYNAAIWPAQVIAYALGVLVVLLSLRPRKGSDKIIAACLAGSWLWTGVVYHMMYFATIEGAAWGFGAAFAMQGILFAWTGAARGRLRFRFSPNLYGWAGLGLVIFSMAVTPLIGSLAGHGWETMNLRKNWAQLAQSNSLAQSGSGRRSKSSNSAPRRKGRLMITARPRSAARGSRRLSASRSRML